MDPPVRKTLDLRRQARLCPTCGQRFSSDGRFCPFDGVPLEPTSFDPLDDGLLGRTIDGRYEVIALLGEGGTGRVYKVRHAALARHFALKILRRDLGRDEELAARFIQEAKATASVRHPNVVEITDFGRLPDGLPYLVMELLVGCTLSDVIKSEGPVPGERAVPLLLQIASALAAAHAVGIVHRDLKPDNVFLVGDARDVRVVDFGAAKVVGASRVTRDGVVFGTPHYMSPEQASGQPVDHRADIYSLGVIMYEMFTGRVPFEADTFMGVLTQHMFVQPVPPSQVTAAASGLGALEEITLVCLAKKPEGRYPSMEALATALEGARDQAGPKGRLPRSVAGDAGPLREGAIRAAAARGAGGPASGDDAEADDPLRIPRHKVPRWVLFAALSSVCFAVAVAFAVRRGSTGAGARTNADTSASPESTRAAAPASAAVTASPPGAAPGLVASGGDRGPDPRATTGPSAQAVAAEATADAGVAVAVP
ncbi:MAG: serine/threonine protein kinase, partial [Myxococcales bacterium]|nr:serine/threonine protein kinase [Myxococcales bacterium]